MENLNVLIANNWRYNTGGIEVWARRLAEGLIHRGHSVAFVVRRDSKWYPQLQADNLKVYAFPMRGDMDPRTVLPLSWMIRRKRVDIILTLRERDFRLAGLAAKLARRGCVVARMRAVAGHDRRQRRHDFQFYRQRWRYNYFAAKVITNSARGKRDLVEGGWLAADRVEVLRNGVDLRVFDPDQVPKGTVRREFGIPRDAAMVALIARVNEAKGQLILAETAVELLKRRPNTFFLFVGMLTRSMYCGKLREFIENSGHAEHLILADFRADVARILADTDVLVLPSAVEGLPNVVLEAMAMRCPVIATDVGGTKEVVEDGVNGFLLSMPIPAGRLCEKLEFLLANPEDRERMGRAGRITVEREFDLRRSVERYEDLFYRVLGEKH
jgi:glycosyltransferase involved in cell wall biosynthesis